MKNRLPVHPFLFGLFPVVNLLAGNVFETGLSVAVPVAAIVLGFVLVLLAICNILTRNILRSGIIVSGLTIFFFSPYHAHLALHAWLSKVYVPAAPFSIHLVFALFFSGIACWTYFFSRKASGFNQLNRLLNIVSICLVAIPTWKIIAAKVSGSIDWPAIHRQQHIEPLPANASAPNSLPDIYLIIMDRYAGAQTLRTVYQFDNRDFLGYLETKGFYLAANSAANYPSTAQSLASSLNMQYLDYVKAFVAPESEDWAPLHHLLRNHRVAQFLQGKGYRYFQLGSWWEPTRTNDRADSIVYFTPLPEMFYVLYGTTMLAPLSDTLDWVSWRRAHWRANQNQFSNLIKTIDAAGPKFVLAHFLLPHDPYVFDRNGDFQPLDRVNERPEEQNYVDQLIFTNSMLQKTLDILLTTPKAPPIIIIQADEGPWPQRYVHQHTSFDWENATDSELNQKMKILNSFYLPGVTYENLSPHISPVNTFRFIFNSYFKTNLPLLPDESFIYRNRRHPYNLKNITARLSH
jgi:hypothetical protein